MRFHRWSVVLQLLGAMALLPPTGTAAQASDCTYDRCALRLQYRFFSTRLIQGADATPVSRLGLFASRIPVLETASDTVRRHYESFRHHRNTGRVFQLIGFAAVTAAAIVYEADTYDNRDTALGILLLGTGFSIVGAIHSQRSAEELQRAIWHYNRLLPMTR